MTRTNAYSLFVILLRAAAVWLVCSLALAVPTYLASGLRGNWPWDVLAVFLLVPSLFAALVWLYADKLARLVMARPNQPLFESDIAASEWQALIFSAIGLWQAVIGFLDTMIHFLKWFPLSRAIRDSGGAMAWPDDYWPDTIASVLQVAVGVGLMLGARGIVAMLHKWRYAGMRNTA
jgi:hypothetical protein